MPVKKGEKIPWDLKNQTPEAKEKRALHFRGKFYPRKSGNYHPPVAVKCHTCGKVYPRAYSLWNRSKYKRFYCTMDCQKAYKYGKNFNKIVPKVQCKCDYCGKEIEKIKSQFESNKHNFCGKPCSYKWKAENLTGDKIYNFTGGHDRHYGPNWGIQRRLCRERDGNKCNACEKTHEENGKNMDVDHQVPFRLFDDYKEANKLSNLWCLCASCHSKKTNWQASVGEATIPEWREAFDKQVKTKDIFNLIDKHKPVFDRLKDK